MAVNQKCQCAFFNLDGTTPQPKNSRSLLKNKQIVVSFYYYLFYGLDTLI